MSKLFYLLGYISHLSVLVPLFLMLVKRVNGKKTLRSGLIKLLFTLLIVSLVADTTSYVMARSGMPSVAVVNIFFFGQFILLSLIYRVILPEYMNRMVLILGILNTIFFLINSFFVQGINNIQSYTASSSGALIMLYAVLYYHQLIKTLRVSDLLKYVPFWINTSVAFYYSFNFLLFIISTYVFLNMKEDEVIAFWGFHNINNILKNTLFTVAIIHLGDDIIELIE